MAFRIRRGERVGEAFERLVREQASEAEAFLRSSGEDTARLVHQARRRITRVRGVLRLFRDALPEGVYDEENARLRDAARLLATSRDATVSRETFDSLLEPGDDPEASGRVRGLLGDPHGAPREGDLAGAREEACRAVGESTRALAEVELEAHGFDAVRKGVRRVMRRVRKAYRDAAREPNDAALHEWRKRAKHQRTAVQILRNANKPRLKRTAEAVDLLCDTLGEIQDLAVLSRRLPDAHDPAVDGLVSSVRERIGARRADLVEVALELGGLVCSTKGRKVERRLATWWLAWRGPR